MKFSIGYNNMDDFIDIVEKYDTHIDEIYFSIPGMESSRPHHLFDDKAENRLHRFLRIVNDQYPAIKLNLLFNGLCNFADYNSNQQTFFKKYGDIIKKYSEEYGIKATTLVSAELSYFIKKTFPHIETQTSVNLLISELKQLSYLHYFDTIIINREINRQCNKIKKIIDNKTHKVKILLNEGCIPHCVNRVQCVNRTSAQQKLIEAGSKINFCGSRFSKNPWLCLQSPAIRPEDLKFYRELGINSWKLATRLKDTPFIDLILDAYIKEEFEGNYFVLFESPANFALHEQYYLNNAEIPEDFIQVVTNCEMDCYNCNFCMDLFNILAEKQPPSA